MIQGHRTYIDNPKLVTTHARKPPLARFHRRWMDGALAAGSRRAKTPQAVECEASQSGPKGNAQ